MPRTRRGSAAPPPADNPLADAVLAALLRTAPDDLAVMVRFLIQWSSMPAKRRAVHLKIVLPDLEDDRVAAAVGVNRTTLHRCPSYRRLKAVLDEPRSPLRGCVDADGFVVDAWEEETL